MKACRGGKGHRVYQNEVPGVIDNCMLFQGAICNRKTRSMAVEVVTKEDLQHFRLQLLNDIRQLINPKEVKVIKPWLKNSELKKLLNISSNTIQRLRITGKLRSSKVGGVHYYRTEDIEKLLNNDAI